MSNLPAEPSVVAAYLTERTGSGVSVATVQLSRAAIAAAHSDANLEDPCAHPGVRRTMSGLSRMFGRASPAGLAPDERRRRRNPRDRKTTPPTALGTNGVRVHR